MPVLGFSLLPPLNHPAEVDIASGIGTELTGLAGLLSARADPCC
jgi:hypothetical protein